MHSLVQFTTAALNAVRLPLKTFAWGPNVERVIAKAGRPNPPRS